MPIIVNTDFYGLRLVNRGKVRDIYEIPGHEDKLLFVATDRISAYDVVMNEGVPGKGYILTQMSLFWFSLFNDVDNHLITAQVDEYPKACWPYADILNGRSMLVRKVKVLPIECIVRGRWTGSYWDAYQKAKINRTESSMVSYKEVCGFKFSTDVRENDIISPALFTPSTKAELGDHDENISLAEMEMIVGKEKVAQMGKMSVTLFERAAEYAAKKGIVIADTKFELGEIDGKLILIDEVLTPDSSRFWPAEEVKPDITPPSFDKQFLRDYLTSIGGKKQVPPPTLPSEIIAKTAHKYLEAAEILGIVV